MRRPWPGACALGAAVLAASCATILGYDDVSPRLPDTPDVASLDALADDVAPADVPPSSVGVHPPGRPGGAAVPSGKGKVLWIIVKRFYLSTQALGSEIPADGGTTPTSKEAWKTIGYDIDHVCTNEKEARENTNTCIRDPASSQLVLLDGQECRDNNFGSQVVPVVQTFDSVFEDDSNQGVLGGANTFVLKLEDLDDGEDDPYVSGKLYRVANIRGYPDVRPTWDGSDVREADRASLVSGSLATPKTAFMRGYVSKNTWVSGEPSSFFIAIPVNKVTAEMKLAGAVMTVKLSSDHTTAGLGMLGGALARTDLESAIAPIARASGLCPDSPIYVSLISTVRKFMDVVMEAPNLQDTTQPCNGISLGLGFEFAKVQPIVEAVDIVPATNPCGDAG